MKLVYKFYYTLPLSLLALLLFLGARAEALPRIAEAPVRDTTFENGLTILAMEDKSDPLVAFWVKYQVGERDEVEGKTGLSHVAREVMTYGSLGYQKSEYGRLIHAGGGSFGSFVYSDNTVFYARVPKRILRATLLMEADRMENPATTRENLESAKAAILRSRQTALENNVYAPLVMELLGRAYPDHPYGRPDFGLAEDITALELDDFRDWAHKFCQPSNAVISIVGDFKTEELFAELAELFADIPSSAKPERSLPALPQQSRERRSRIKGPIQIPVFIAGYPVPPAGDPDRLPLELLASIMFEERSSKIPHALVVESGLCLQAAGNVANFEGQGLIYYFAFMNRGELFENAESLIESQLELVVSGELTEGDLIIAKNQMEAEFYRFSAGALQRAGQISRAYAINGNPLEWVDRLKKLKAVTLKDISRVAREYLREDKRTIIFFDPSLSESGGEEN